VKKNGSLQQYFGKEEADTGLHAERKMQFLRGGVKRGREPLRAEKADKTTGSAHPGGGMFKGGATNRKKACRPYRKKAEEQRKKRASSEKEALGVCLTTTCKRRNLEREKEHRPRKKKGGNLFSGAQPPEWKRTVVTGRAANRDLLALGKHIRRAGK